MGLDAEERFLYGCRRGKPEQLSRR
jgi:hypothetical protein